MKRLILYLLLMYTVHLTSQTYFADFEVLSNSGMTSRSLSFSVDFTIGETLDEAIHGNNYTFVQGFQQPEYAFITDSKSIPVFKEMIVYPNPTHGKLFFKIGALKQIQNGEIKIYNLIGQIIEVIEVRDYSINATIDMSHIDDGCYILEYSAMNRKRRIIQKVVKI